MNEIINSFSKIRNNNEIIDLKKYNDFYGKKISPFIIENERRINIDNYQDLTYARAIAKKSSFYDWVFNGEKLYKVLKKMKIETYETYPHGITEIILNFKGNNSKIERRRKAMKKLGLTLIEHENIDFIDAALCSLTAHAKLTDDVIYFR